MDNKDLTNNIVTAIREMRHKGVSIMIASQIHQAYQMKSLN
jgi:hypothetical protein